MEKTYLNLLNGNPYIADLEKYAGKIENRVRVDISDEIKSFFYIETPEGYYASEHEVIWLHMLLSWGYSLRGEYEKACVEARKAGHLLSAPWSEEGYFDDPMLRIFLAGLWTMCGSWEDARVDLRRAWDLDNSLDWALELAERDVPPANIIFILGGVGPLLYWDPESNQNPLRGWRHISFQKQGRKSDGYLRDSKNVTLNMLLSPDSSNWYQRHWLRNNAIKELIDDSKYGQRILGASSLRSAEIATGVAFGVTTATLLVGMGGGLIYLAIQINSGEVATIGLGIALGGLAYGRSIIKRTTEDSVRDLKRDLDISRKYRFVRFLPEYIWVGWSDKELEYPLRFEIGDEIFYDIMSVVDSKPFVSIKHVADVDEKSAPPSVWLTPEEALQKWVLDFLEEINKDNNWEKWQNELKKFGVKDLESFGDTDQGQELKIKIVPGVLTLTIMRGLFKEEQMISIAPENKTTEKKSKEYFLIQEKDPKKFAKEVTQEIWKEIERLKLQEMKLNRTK